MLGAPFLSLTAAAGRQPHQSRLANILLNLTFTSPALARCCERDRSECDMVQPKGSGGPYVPPRCPVCQHPQTRVQRRLTENTNGSTMYVCIRVGQCSVGMNLSKMDTWVAV